MSDSSIEEGLFFEDYIELRPTLAEATETALNEALNEIVNLGYSDDILGDGRDTIPADETTDQAVAWLESLYKENHRSTYAWERPHVTAGPEGEVVLEWWRGTKKLTVYILGNSAAYIKVSGPDIFEDMEEGTADTPEQRAAIWRWLMG